MYYMDDYKIDGSCTSTTSRTSFGNVSMCSIMKAQAELKNIEYVSLLPLQIRESTFVTETVTYVKKWKRRGRCDKIRIRSRQVPSQTMYLLNPNKMLLGSNQPMLIGHPVTIGKLKEKLKNINKLLQM